MSNDTSGVDQPDSHPPLISGGNGPIEPSVASDMDDITPTPNAATGTDPIAGSPAATTEPPTADRSADAAPFDYAAYYGADPSWQVSSRQPAAPAPVAASPAEPPRTSRDGFLFFVGALAAGVLGAALTLGVLAATGTLSGDDTIATSSTTVAAQQANTTPSTITRTVITNEGGATVDPTAVARKTIPSIVTVTTYEGATADELTPVGSGSGVVFTEDGYIATNEHVVNGASDYRVTFEDGRLYEATLIGSDALTDVAVLKIDATGLTPVEFGSTDALHLGDPAVAVGNPLGQEGGSSVSVGIVSAFDRRVDFGDGSNLFGMLQTDAAINSGSSGGALFDAEGRLIGITSAIGVSNAGPEGIGYAIPVELVRRITDEIIETGDVQHPFLGVTIATHQDERADGAIAPDGAEVVTIEGTDSAAGAAGLQAGDVIIRIGDEEITSQNDLILAVRLYRVGDEVTFVALRDGEPQEFSVVMGQRPEAFGG